MSPAPLGALHGPPFGATSSPMPKENDIRASVERSARRALKARLDAARASEVDRRAIEDASKSSARRREDEALAVRRANEDAAREQRRVDEDRDRHARRDAQLAIRLARIEANFGR